jgi:hypothetical protein
MDDQRFNAMAKQFGVFEAMSDAELRERLRLAGCPEPANKMDAVMDNMRREFGGPSMTEWFAECGKRGILA